MKTAILIPVHNRRELTAACVRRLAAERLHDWADILVIDDGSTDGTAGAVRQALPSAIILRGTGNWWWTGAIVHGMETALRAGAERLVWLNDDARPAPGAIRRLCDVATERQAIAGGVCTIPGTNEVVYGGHRGRGFGFELLPLKPGVVEECEALSGNLVCIPRAVVERIGLPDAARLPHALADLDYTLRARQRGLPVVVVHDARAEAVPNAWDNHASWLCSDVPLRVVWEGLWRKSSYGYLPAQWTLFTRHWGWRGALHVAWLVMKRVPITILRLTTTLEWRRRRWGAESRAWLEERRLREAMAPATRPPENGR